MVFVAKQVCGTLVWVFMHIKTSEIHKFVEP